MKLTLDQIDSLWLPDYVDFAKAIESTVRQQDAELVRELVDALKYHQEQTRPIHRTQEALTSAQQWLEENK